MNAQDAIAQVLQEHALELCEDENTTLFLSEWLVLAMYVDDDGEASLVLQGNQNQLRSHTLGLIAMAQEEL